MRLTLSPAWAVLAVLVCPVSLPAQQPRPPEDFQIAVGLLQRGMHQEAASYLQRFLQQNRGHALAREAWYRLGTCQVETGAKEKAVTSFEKALSGRSGQFRLAAECTYRLATTLLELERQQDALPWLQRLLQDIGKDHYLYPAACYAAGECYRDLGRDEDAVAAFQAAAESAVGEQASFRFPALYQAGFCELRRDRPAAAADLFDRAAQAAGDSGAAAECHYLAGDAALRAGQLDRAERALAEALQAGGEFADDALLGLGFCAVRRERTDEALQRFRLLVRRHQGSPLVPQARVEIGRLLYRSGSCEEARRELAAVLAVSGLSPALRATALELDGLAALELGDAEAARPALEAALQLVSTDADRARLQEAIGEALAAAGDPEAALAAFAKVDRRAAGDAVYGDALYGRCLALHRLGRYADSVRVAEELLRELPDHRLAVLARFAVGENLFAQNDHARAEESYAGIPKDHELRPQAEFKHAWCAYLRGDKAEAARRFAAIAANRQHPYSEESLSLQALALLEAGALDQALEAADRYRARHPKGAHLARTERVAARVLRQRNDLRGAAARLQQAAAAAGADEAAADRLEQAEVLFERGDYDAAAKVYRELTERRDETGARAFEGLAWCAFELGDDEACLAALRAGHRHPALGKGKAALFELESALHHRNRDWAEAERVAREYLEEFAGEEGAARMRYALGVAQARAGKLDAAERTLGELAKTGSLPDSDRVHYELAWVLRRAGKEVRALEEFAKVASESGDQDLAGEARLHLGVAALEQGDADTARKLLLSVQGSHRGRALYRLGFFDLEHAGDDPEALRRARGAFEAIAALGEQEPLFLEATFLVGECFYRAGKAAEAAPRFEALLQADAEHERAQAARLRLGECSVLAGHPDTAVAALAEYLRRAGAGASDTGAAERARAHLWLGRARQARSEFERAEQSYRQVTTLSEGELAAEAQYRIGECRLARDDLQGAADAFVKLPILYAHEQWVRRGLLQAGITYEKLRQPAKARRFYEELTNRYPDSPESREAASRLRGI